MRLLIVTQRLRSDQRNYGLTRNRTRDFCHIWTLPAEPTLRAGVNRTPMKKTESGLWKHGLVLTLLFGFTAMLVGGAYIYKTRAPIPVAVTNPSGGTLFTAV